MKLICIIISFLMVGCATTAIKMPNGVEITSSRLFLKQTIQNVSISGDNLNAEMTGYNIEPEGTEIIPETIEAVKK